VGVDGQVSEAKKPPDKAGGWCGKLKEKKDQSGCRLS
jgi:hypothetical protein